MEPHDSPDPSQSSGAPRQQDVVPDAQASNTRPSGDLAGTEAPPREPPGPPATGANDHSGSGDEPPKRPKKRRRSWFARILIGLAALAVGLVAVPLLAGAFALIVMAPNLPSIDAITVYHPKEPLRIFTADHV